MSDPKMDSTTIARVEGECAYIKSLVFASDRERDNHEMFVAYGDAVALLAAAKRLHAIQCDDENTIEEYIRECLKPLDDLWSHVLVRRNPNYGPWEYPGQAYRHLKVEFDEMEAAAKDAESLRALLGEVLSSYTREHLNATCANGDNLGDRIAAATEGK